MSSRTEGDANVSVPADVRSPRAKLIYLYLAVRGEATADEACDALDVDKGTLLAVTGTLRDRGYVRRRSENGAFSVE